MSPLYFHYYDGPTGSHNIKNFAKYYVDTTGVVKNGVFTVATPGDYYLSFYARGPYGGDPYALGYIEVNGAFKAKSLNFNKKINSKNKNLNFLK